MHTFFINASQKELSSYNSLFDVYLTNKTLVTMECPLSKWWDAQEGYKSRVKEMGDIIDIYAELNNAYNLIIYIDLTEDNDYSNIPRDERHQKARDELSSALHTLYNYLIKRTIVDELIRAGRAPLGVLIMFGEDKRFDNANTMSAGCDDERINTYILNYLGFSKSKGTDKMLEEAISSVSNEGGNVHASFEVIKVTLCQKIKGSPDRVLAKGFCDAFIDEMLDSWYTSTIGEGGYTGIDLAEWCAARVLAANTALVKDLREKLSNEVQSANMDMVSCPYDCFAVRTNNKRVRALAKLNICIHVLKCLEAGSVFEYRTGGSGFKERTPIEFTSYAVEELLPIFKAKEDEYKAGLKELVHIKDNYGYSHVRLAPELYAFDYNKLGLDEFGNKDDSISVSDKNFLSGDAAEEAFNQLRSLVNTGDGKNSQIIDSRDVKVKEIYEKDIITKAGVVKRKHEKFLNRLKENIDSLLPRYAGNSEDNMPALLKRDDIRDINDDDSGETKKPLALKGVKNKAETAYKTILNDYFKFCANRNVTVTDVSKQYEWLLTRVQQISGGLRKIKLAAIGLLIALIVLYVPFVIIQFGAIFESMFTFTVAILSFVVPLVILCLVLVIVAIAERKKYAMVLSEFEQKSDAAMASNRAAVNHYAEFLFNKIPALRRVYNYKLDVGYYAECCSVADEKIKHHESKLKERLDLISNIIKDLEITEREYENCKEAAIPDGDFSDGGKAIDYTVPFCKGKKNSKFYTIILCEMLAGSKD